jgi:hypothetical protein
MFKSNKPLPKYNWGGWNSENMNQVNWKAMGQSSAQGTAQIASTYNDPNSTEYDKYNATSSSLTNTVGSINPIFQMGVGVGNSIGKPIQASSEQINPDTGKISDPRRAKRNAMIGSIFNPIEAFSYRQASGNWGDVKGDDYVKWLESNKGQQFAMGGMNMVPNAEVEGGENSMTLDGQYTEYDGPSHEAGGIPTSLEPQERVFSDRLKDKLTKKTFAELNKINNTNKEDKILDTKYGTNESKKTAQLMKQVKAMNSDKIFNKQESQKLEQAMKYLNKKGLGNMFAFGGINGENDPLSEFIKQRYKADAVPGKVKKYNPEDKDLTFVDKLGRVPLEGSRFQTDSVVNIPGADPNLKAAYKNGKFVIVGTNPKAQQMAAEINKGKFVQGSDKTVYPDYSGYLPKKAYGGEMLPKYFNGGTNPLKQRQDEDSYINAMSARDQQDYQRWFTTASGDEGFNPDQYSVSNYVEQYLPHMYKGKQSPMTSYGTDFNMATGEGLTNADTSQKTSQQPSGNKYFTKDNMYKAGFQLAQNAGQLAYLAEQGKKYDTQKYYGFTPKLLDSKAAINDVNVEGRFAEKNIKDASAGNVGSYLSNRTGLMSKVAQGKERVRMNYDNANAGILNQSEQFNIGNRYRVDDVNAQNKGRALSNYYATLGSLGTNTAQGMKDSRMMNIEGDVAKSLPKLFSSPEFQKFVKENPNLFGKS